MEYENPHIPEGINTSRAHPLKEFLILSAGALGLLVIVSVLLAYFGAGLARLVPFETELKLAGRLAPESDPDSPLRRYLQITADRVAGVMELPEGMQIRVRYRNGGTVNAFATLGGNIILFRGLLELIPNENTLAMLLAHEIAHIEHRDPIESVGRSAGIMAGIAILLGDSPSGALGNTGLFTQLYFSREAEAAADRAALAALVALYGHAAGATTLFDILREKREHDRRGEPPAFFSTHPLDKQRVQAVEEAMAAHGWTRDGATTALPAEFSGWLNGAG